MEQLFKNDIKPSNQASGLRTVSNSKFLEHPISVINEFSLKRLSSRYKDCYVINLSISASYFFFYLPKLYELRETSSIVSAHCMFPSYTIHLM